MTQDTDILPQPREGIVKPPYLQQEILDKAVEDGENSLRKRMELLKETSNVFQKSMVE